MTDIPFCVVKLYEERQLDMDQKENLSRTLRGKGFRWFLISYCRCSTFACKGAWTLPAFLNRKAFARQNEETASKKRQSGHGGDSSLNKSPRRSPACFDFRDSLATTSPIFRAPGSKSALRRSPKPIFPKPKCSRQATCAILYPDR